MKGAPSLVPRAAVLEELAQREDEIQQRERALRPSRGWREEMLDELRQERTRAGAIP